MTQPLLHSEIVVLRAPAQAWSGADGSMGSAAIHGLYFSDTRIVSTLRIRVGGTAIEPIAVIPDGASTVSFVGLTRAIDDESADPRVRSLHRRTVVADGLAESLTLESTLGHAVETSITVSIGADLAPMDLVKSGLSGEPAEMLVAGQTARWGTASVIAKLDAPGALLGLDSTNLDLSCLGLSCLGLSCLDLSWVVTIPAKGSVTVGWTVTVADSRAVVSAVTGRPNWSIPTVEAGDDRLTRWVSTALGDLDALRLSTVAEPDATFLAAGAPWFFTLFGRDSIWAARFMLPLGTTLAADTLRVLAGLQGTTAVAATAEQPGKIMHELRRETLTIPGENISLPPLYYGTVDATPLWACLLHDAWRWGMPDSQVEALIPNLVAALEWMRDYGDADGDGLLEYVDDTGTGLSNQGWKDSGDSVQWRDGRLAEGPIALCEVQAYAFEAATHGADLLEHFGFDGTEWRRWAARLRSRFAETFWVDDPAGAYPAIALDVHKRAVDTVTSNIGHLLGTGLLDRREAALVARRLGSPALDSGYGLRTMSTDSAGYWPLSYHGGSVWTHDTAIAIAGLTREGFAAEAASLTKGLLAAASAFGYRMPELHSGDPASRFSVPVAYPAACRPQAWSAAAAISVLSSTLGLRPDAQAGYLGVSPGTAVGALSVHGLRLGDQDVSVTTNRDGEVIASAGAPVQVE